MQGTSYRILVLGASYGLLFAVRAALGGHHVTVVCRDAEAKKINANGPFIHTMARKSGAPILVSRDTADLDLVAVTPDKVDPTRFDLIVLAMQEPQFTAPDIRSLAFRIAASGQPVVSIMNIALPPYLKRLEGVWNSGLSAAYHAPDLWEAFSPDTFTHSSPDPQAVRMDPTLCHHMRVSLPSNFKIAPFQEDGSNDMLHRICRSANRAPMLKQQILRPPVLLAAAGSEFTPLAKWPMLITGNYRCLDDEGLNSISDTVLRDKGPSRRIYESVQELCLALGAAPQDLIPFDAYCTAARQLSAPSSVARALFQSATKVERMDRIIWQLMNTHGLPNHDIEAIVDRVDKVVAQNIREMEH